MMIKLSACITISFSLAITLASGCISDPSIEFNKKQYLFQADHTGKAYDIVSIPVDGISSIEVEANATVFYTEDDANDIKVLLNKGSSMEHGDIGHIRESMGLRYKMDRDNCCYIATIGHGSTGVDGGTYLTYDILVPSNITVKQNDEDPNYYPFGVGGGGWSRDLETKYKDWTFDPGEPTVLRTLEPKE